MKISVKFLRHDTGNYRVYYQRIESTVKSLYCVQDGIWYLCSKDGEPEAPLKKGLQIVINDSTGVIGNTTIK